MSIINYKTNRKSEAEISIMSNNKPANVKAFKDNKAHKKANLIAKTSTDVDKGRTARTTWAQRDAILEWLEVEANFKIMVGQATKGMKTVQGGLKLNKKSGCKDLGDFVNQRTGSKWQPKQTIARYDSVIKNYKVLIIVRANTPVLINTIFI